MSEREYTNITVGVGEDGRTYQGGNFLNSIEEVVSFFTELREVEPSMIVGLMRAYAEDLEQK